MGGNIIDKSDHADDLVVVYTLRGAHGDIKVEGVDSDVRKITHRLKMFDRLVYILGDAAKFIENGVEYGYIKMPDMVGDAALTLWPQIVNAITVASGVNLAADKPDGYLHPMADLKRYGVVCVRLGDFDNPPRDGFAVWTNVQGVVAHHASDGGFEWGYGGSGPSDLALNILQAVLDYFPNHDRGEMVECWRGQCFQLAWDLHQKFKFDFLMGMDKQGGIISWDGICVWLTNNTDQVWSL